MISVKIICIGKLKEKFFREACSEYEKRLSRFCSLKIRELPEAFLQDAPSDAEISAALLKESEAISKEIPKGAFVCSLCIEGCELSSPCLAEKIETLAANGSGSLCFIIGSSFGLDNGIKQKSDLRLSFSKMTFPHQLFRVLLLEQIYRSFSIINKMKYHK